VSYSTTCLSFDSQMDSQQGKFRWTVAATTRQEQLKLSAVADTNGRR
jgi:hypothetical protein